MRLNRRQLFDLRLETEGMAPGTTYRRVCPACSGGDSKEKSFSVVVNSSLVLYNCFRASCGVRGAFSRDGSHSPEITKPRKKPRKEFKWGLANPTVEQLEEFRNRYGIPFAFLANAEMQFCPERGSYVYVLQNLHGGRIGLMERWYPKWQPRDELILKGDRPKTLLYPERGYEGPLYHLAGPLEASVVLVEDILSALKISRFRPAISLCGVHVPAALIYELAKSGVTKVVICLDPDARAKALALRDQLSLYFSEVKVCLGLNEDPKDAPLKELEEVLVGV